jgi:glycosyltransferase involved in cell wall biosynthesis
MKVPLSVLIPTLNEAGNLRDCIASINLADEIVVVDSGSTDGTQEIAKTLGARVVNFDWNGRLPKKKNWALANVDWQNEWVFILDADERFDARLMNELAKLLANPQPSIVGYYVNRRFWFMDGWLNHCGYYPSWNLRFFRHRLGRYELLPNVEDTGSGDNEVHEHVNLEGKSGHLTAELEHFAFPSISIWVEKHNRYSNWEARLDIDDSASQSAKTANIDPILARKRRLKHMARRLPFRPLLRFVYHYILREGFRDGYRGFVFCRLMGIYEFLSAAKGSELRRQRPHSH